MLTLALAPFEQALQMFFQNQTPQMFFENPADAFYKSKPKLAIWGGHGGEKAKKCGCHVVPGVSHGPHGLLDLVWQWLHMGGAFCVVVFNQMSKGPTDADTKHLDVFTWH